MKDNKYSRTLPVPLTPEEFETKSSELSNLVLHIVSEKARIKFEAKRAKDQIEQLETDCLCLSHVVTDRMEDRSVQCEDRFIFAEQKVISIRLDTGVVIGTRAMTLQEYQQEMDLRSPVLALHKDKAAVNG